MWLVISSVCWWGDNCVCVCVWGLYKVPYRRNVCHLGAGSFTEYNSFPQTAAVEWNCRNKTTFSRKGKRWNTKTISLDTKSEQKKSTDEGWKSCDITLWIQINNHQATVEFCLPASLFFISLLFSDSQKKNPADRFVWIWRLSSVTLKVVASCTTDGSTS